MQQGTGKCGIAQLNMVWDGRGALRIQETECGSPVKLDVWMESIGRQREISQGDTWQPEKDS